MTEEVFNSEKYKLVCQLKRALKYAIEDRVSLKIPELDLSSLKVIGFSDFSFTNKHDFSSQLEYLFFLENITAAATPISFKSYKAKRVTHFAMLGEVVSFTGFF